MTDEQKKSLALVTVRFYEDDLVAGKDASGVWVPVKRVCEALGITEQRQSEKLKGKAWAVTTMRVATGPDGKSYEMLCIHVDSLPMWLATMDADRVAPAARAKLERYQIECARVLRNHFARVEAHDFHLQRLREFVAEKALPHKVTWHDKLVKEMGRIYGLPYTLGSRHPAWMANFQDMLYRIMYGNDVIDEIKRINPEPKFGSNHHQHFKRHDLLEQDILIVYTHAFTSGSPIEFWNKIRFQYGRQMLQQDWTVPGTIPAHRPAAKARKPKKKP
jgi:hypothetical protein